MGFMDKVKGVAGEVGDTFKKGVKSVSDGSQKFTDKMKLKKQVTDLENEIKQIYSTIGKIYIENNKDNVPENISALAESLKAKNAELAQVKEELDALNDKPVCPTCGAVLQKEQRFCDKCGTKVVHEAEHVEADVVAETQSDEQSE